MAVSSSILHSLRSLIAVSFNCIFVIVSTGQTFTPIRVDGFNHDVVAEGPGRNALAKTSREMDAIDPSNFVICTKQFARANNMPNGYGIPDRGDIGSGVKSFFLNSFTAKNVLYLLQNQEGELRLQEPGHYNRLSILGLATEGSAVLHITLGFTDLTKVEIGNKNFPDWFDGPNPLVMGFGRVKRAAGSEANPLYFEGAPENPRMYTIDVLCQPGKKLTYIHFRNVSPNTNAASNRAFVFAISGVKVEPVEEKTVALKKEIVPIEKKEIPVEKKTDPEEKVTITEKKIDPIEEKIISPPEKIILTGVVLDEKTNKPVQATLNFIGTKTFSLVNEVNGNYAAEFPELSEYTVKIETQGYVGKIAKINLASLPTRQVNFMLTPIEVGALVKMNSILFEQSSPKLREESFQELDLVADFLKSNPKVSINLAGHTDNRGDRKLNLKLSNDRVTEVKKYLVNTGIEARRITGKGYGGSKPVAKGNNEEAWRLNRRVEFTITGM